MNMNKEIFFGGFDGAVTREIESMYNVDLICLSHRLITEYLSEIHYFREKQFIQEIGMVGTDNEGHVFVEFLLCNQCGDYTYKGIMQIKVVRRVATNTMFYTVTY